MSKKSPSFRCIKLYIALELALALLSSLAMKTIFFILSLIVSLPTLAKPNSFMPMTSFENGAEVIVKTRLSFSKNAALIFASEPETVWNGLNKVTQTGVCEMRSKSETYTLEPESRLKVSNVGARKDGSPEMLLKDEKNASFSLACEIRETTNLAFSNRPYDNVPSKNPSVEFIETILKGILVFN